MSDAPTPMDTSDGGVTAATATTATAATAATTETPSAPRGYGYQNDPPQCHRDGECTRPDHHPGHCKVSGRRKGGWVRGSIHDPPPRRPVLARQSSAAAAASAAAAVAAFRPVPAPLAAA